MMMSAGQVCAAIKELTPERKLLLCGGHVAAVPQRTLREEAADFVAGGDGLRTVVAVVDALETPVPSFAKVRGLWDREDDSPRAITDAPLVRDLPAALPSP